MDNCCFKIKAGDSKFITGKALYSLTTPSINKVDEVTIAIDMKGKFSRLNFALTKGNKYNQKRILYIAHICKAVGVE